jgi:glycosyltransferase involved in cell wall biosynthesis
MNILTINQSDIMGGAAIAAHRLHEGLLAQGFDSRLLVGESIAGGDRVAPIPRLPSLERPLLRITRPLGLNYLNILGSFVIPRHPFFRNAEVLHLHNLHSGYFNYLALPMLCGDKPTIFTLHDMWSFTGHCAYSYECDRWKVGCGRCPHPETYPAVERDSTRLEWRIKRWIYSRSQLTIVTPSRWLAEQARQSMLNRFPIHHIANGIDIEAYQPLDPEAGRLALGIPRGKRVIMFGAQSLRDWRKGGDLLVKALEHLPPSLKGEILLMTIGDAKETMSHIDGMAVLNLGYVGGDRLKRVAYSAADVFVLPTRADNLPVVLQESMACGTPMVSFDVGGVPELVRHGITGYLARTDDYRDFSKGIAELLADEPMRVRMGLQCRETAMKDHSLELQAQRYIDLYRQVVRERGKGEGKRL